MQISLKSTKFPRILGQLSHSVQFFKVAAFGSLLLCGILVALLAYSVTRPPEIIALTPSGSAYKTAERPKAEDEIEEAVRAYIERRYNWTSRDLEAQSSAAQAFILPAQRLAFREGMKSVLQFAREKPTARRVYPKKIKVELEKKSVLISGDRIAVIQGLWAANELKLVLNFESGARTGENPWGIYITKEKED